MTSAGSAKCLDNHEITLSIIMAYHVAKLSSEKTFTVRVENSYLWENFCSSMLVDLYTQSMRPQNEWLQIVHSEDL